MILEQEEVIMSYQAPAPIRATGLVTASLAAALAVAVITEPAAAAPQTSSNFATLSARGDLEPGTKLIVTAMLNRASGSQSFNAEFVEFAPAAIVVKVATSDVDPDSTDLVIRDVETGSASWSASASHVLIEIPEARASRIAKTDSLVNGASIGAVVGVATPLVGGLAHCGRDLDNCSESKTMAVLLGAAALGGALGGLLGAAIDAGHVGEGSVLFQSPAIPTPRVSALVPIVSQRRKGLAFVIRW